MRNLILVAAEVTSSNRMEYPTSCPNGERSSSATRPATVVAATLLGYWVKSVRMSTTTNYLAAAG